MAQEAAENPASYPLAGARTYPAPVKKRLMQSIRDFVYQGNGEFPTLEDIKLWVENHKAKGRGAPDEFYFKSNGCALLRRSGKAFKFGYDTYDK